MPARTTVISSITGRHNDLLQMADRAGRRGYDIRGHCVITQTRHAPLSDECITPSARAGAAHLKFMRPATAHYHSRDKVVRIACRQQIEGPP